MQPDDGEARAVGDVEAGGADDAVLRVGLGVKGGWVGWRGGGGRDV